MLLRLEPLFALALATVLATHAPAQAQPRLSATLTATQACPATASTHGGTGPALEPGHQYQVVAQNRPDPTFFQILLDGQRRWVATTCGQLDPANARANVGANAAAAPTPNSQQPGTRATYVFAMSWEPAFCRAHADRPECAPTEPGAAGRQLSLHGLWPQPRGKAYCNVDPALAAADRAHQWDRLPEPDISPRTRQRLAAQMPGLESGLERHEWVVHGTCSGLPADAYFNRAADLSEQINATNLPAFFAQNEGRTLNSAAIRAAFDQAFGPGAGARILISCPSRTIQEFDLNLAGDVTGTAKLPDLLLAAAPIPPGCPAGLVTTP